MGGLIRGIRKAQPPKDVSPEGQQPRPLQKAERDLNHPTLVAARAAAIDEERTRLEQRFKKTASRSDREAIAAARLRADPLPDFVSIRVGWLRKTLRAGS